MSSQSLNATAYSGYAASTILGYIPTRDASDITRAKREMRSVAEATNTSGRQPANWIQYTPSYRISKRFGNWKCSGCNGNFVPVA